MLARLFAIGFGIAVIFPALIYNGLTTAYPAPERSAFFPQFEQPLPQTATAEERKGRQDQMTERQRAYNEAQRNFSRVLLVVATVLGAAGIIAGCLLPSAAIGTGLMLGGAIAVATGYWSYSSLNNDWWRFASLLVGFAALLLAGERLRRRGAEMGAR